MGKSLFIHNMEYAVMQRKSAKLAKCPEVHDAHMQKAHQFEGYSADIKGWAAVEKYLARHLKE